MTPQSIIIFAFFLSVVPTTQSTPLNGKYCRLYEGMSRCVDPPLMVEDEDLWCPYHVCAPSYIAAPQCPASEAQATHKCKATIVDKPAYRCLEGRVHTITKLPVGCGKETFPCTSEVRTCACVQFSPDRKYLSPIIPITPICEE